MKNKKGNVGMMVGTFITAVLAVILIANLLFPTVKSTTDIIPYTDTYNRTNNGANQTATLTHSPVDTIISVANSTGGFALIENTNYTVDKAAGTVTFLDNKVPNGTNGLVYTINYNYQPANYLTSTADRVVMGMVLIAALIGLIYWLFVQFGLG